MKKLRHDPDTARRLGLAIEQAQRRVGLTQTAAAKAANMHLTQYRRFMTGEREASVAVIQRLSKAFGIPIELPPAQPEETPAQTPDYYRGLLAAARRLRVQAQGIEDEALNGLASPDRLTQAAEGAARLSLKDREQAKKRAHK